MEFERLAPLFAPAAERVASRESIGDASEARASHVHSPILTSPRYVLVSPPSQGATKDARYIVAYI